MTTNSLIVVFFLYGLAFFCMGIAIFLEEARGANTILRHALRPLAAFGFLHGTHEWLEMFELIGILNPQNFPFLIGQGIRIALLTFSFLSLAAFGSYLIASNERSRRMNMLVPLGLVTIWGMGSLILLNIYRDTPDLWDVIDVWTRYTVGIPGSILASAGLIVQQRVFRRQGLRSFGRDSLWAAVAFLWYGMIGQVFTRPSPLPPSDVVNSLLFLQVFGIPIQFVRAGAAIVAAIFIIRVLRAFDVQIQRHIESLQVARITEAEHREALQRELFKRVVEAQEAERQRIARELHDETGQSLTAIGLGLRGVAGVLRTDPERASINLRQLEGTTTNALTELQRLIADLRPSHLDDLGLPAALRWYARAIEERAPLTIDVQIQGEPQPLTPEINTTIFRIFQEALTNIIKHAAASNVWVNLAYLSDQITMQVRDDGKGFNTEIRSNPQRPTWGLTGMEERAALLGGRLHVFSLPGKGTLVEMAIPILEQEKSNGNSPAPR